MVWRIDRQTGKYQLPSYVEYARCLLFDLADMSVKLLERIVYNQFFLIND